MMRATLPALLIALGAAMMPLTEAHAAPPSDAVTIASTGPTDVSAQQRRRPRVRIYRQTYDRGVIPSYFPGSNAVRDCNVAYVQEFRPSGTVIAPHMTCFWRQP